MTTTLRSATVDILVALVACAAAHAEVIHIKPAAQGVADGSSWSLGAWGACG